jgi:NAD(P)-dependent dehydrogenase (short-subunit alcohol dehydrogenase family)
MSELRFDDRVIIVTGAGRGLGQEYALELASRGARVVVNDVGVSADEPRYAGVQGEPDATDPAAEVVTLIEKAGGQAVANHASVADPDGAASIVADAVDNFGRVDGIINNAGVVITAPFPELTVADFLASWQVHVIGAFLVSQNAWPVMQRQGGGRILNVCSVDGVVVGNVEHIAYDAAKAGAAGLTRGMAVEGAAHGIAVNGILPGGYTRGQKSLDQSLTPAAVIDMRPQLVAPSACWLVHEQCDVTGAFFTSAAARIARIFTGVGEGFQDDPAKFSIERIRDNWERAMSFEPYESPRSTKDWNAMRIRLFKQMESSLAAGSKE